MKKIGIYKITSPTNKVYIGQSREIFDRWNRFYYKLNCKGQPKLYNSLAKYGVENHKFEIIEECNESLLNEREIYWGNLNEVLRHEKGLNTKELGKNGKHSEETKRKISEKLKGRNPLINKTKEEIKELYKNRNKTNLINALTNRNVSQETRNKISQSSKGISRNKGRIVSKGTRNKMSRSVENRIFTPERLEKMRKSMIGKGVTPIICINTNEHFSSIKEAAEKYNLKKASIDNILSGKAKQTRKLHLTFKYL